jgi:hypothetical protein
MNKEQQDKLAQAIQGLELATIKLESIELENKEYVIVPAFAKLEKAKAELFVLLAKQYVAILTSDLEMLRIGNELELKYKEVSRFVRESNEEDLQREIVKGVQ